MSASLVESDAPLPPAVRGRYLPLELIGEGAGTRVYRAYDTHTGRDIALQILREMGELEPLRRRFLKSARAAMRVCHPAVVSCFEAGETEAGLPYVTMELLRGETLGRLLGRVKRLDPALALRLFLDAAAGLAAIHRAGLIHRDVKPDNLFLVGPRGAPLGLKVLDFGLCKLITSGHEEPSHLIVGTTEYMPPEQVVCDPVDARSDVYSLGAVMFRTLTGELPFAAQQTSMMAHHLVTPAPPPSWLVDELPPGLQGAVLAALRKHPDNRFDSMAALHATLERIAEGEGRVGDEPPLTHDPDRYEPRGEHARRALRAIGALAA